MELEPARAPGHRTGQRSPIAGRWTPVVTFLREHPGDWFYCPYSVTGGTANQVNRGVLADFRPAGHFEAGWADGRIVMRYVGEGVDGQ